MLRVRFLGGCDVYGHGGFVSMGGDCGLSGGSDISIQYPSLITCSIITTIPAVIVATIECWAMLEFVLTGSVLICPDNWKSLCLDNLGSETYGEFSWFFVTR
jgi:hypothetical protein